MNKHSKPQYHSSDVLRAIQNDNWSQATEMWYSSRFSNEDRQYVFDHLCKEYEWHEIQPFSGHDQLNQEDYSSAFLAAYYAEKMEVMTYLLPWVDFSYQNYSVFKMSCMAGFTDFVALYVNKIPENFFDLSFTTSLMLKDQKEVAQIVLPYCLPLVPSLVKNLNYWDRLCEAQWVEDWAKSYQEKLCLSSNMAIKQSAPKIRL